jgi:SAM-dependent methyltransferase
VAAVGRHLGARQLGDRIDEQGVFGNNPLRGQAHSLECLLMLVVPDRFNKNAAGVRNMGPPAETGAWLIRYMCERIGIADLSGFDVLDFGCGSRFADSFVNRRIPIRSYLGIDVDREMIDFLNSNIDDPRLSFVWWNAGNPGYNPAGEPLGSFKSLPVGDRGFDAICMFSVITHQLPEDTEIILRLQRRHIRAGGHLFFSANLQVMDEDHKEMFPESPTGHSVYSLGLLTRIIERTGWRIASIEPKLPLRSPEGHIPIQNSLLCVPV